MQNNFIPLTNRIMFHEIYVKNISFLENFLESYFHYPKNYLQNKIKIHNKKINNYKFKNNLLNTVLSFENNLIDIEVYNKLNFTNLQKSKKFIMRLYQLDLNNNFKNFIQINIVKECHVKCAKKIKNQYQLLKNNNIPDAIGRDLRIDIIRLDLLPIKKEDKKYNENLDLHLRILNANNLEQINDLVQGDEQMEKILTKIKEFIITKETEKLFNETKWLERNAKEEGYNIAKEKIIKLIEKDLSKEQINKIKQLSYIDLN